MVCKSFLLDTQFYSDPPITQTAAARVLKPGIAAASAPRQTLLVDDLALRMAPGYLASPAVFLVILGQQALLRVLLGSRTFLQVALGR